METKSPGLFKRLCQGLSKTHNGLVNGLERLFTRKSQIDEDLFDELEEILILADLGAQTTSRIVEKLKEEVRRKKIKEASLLEPILQTILIEMLTPFQSTLDISSSRPYIILVLGVNGVGKTTTIGKLAARYEQEGKKVLLAAGDTFRAAAIEQLQIWGERAKCAGVIKHQPGADPSAVVYDALQAARARDAHVVMIDTAGRLHNKNHLIAELQKMKRIISREIPGAPHEILLILDATTGQNGLQQVKQFNDALEGITGIALTKLDGTAKGGILFSIVNELSVPVKLIGIGEEIKDLRNFSAEEFVSALFEKTKGNNHG